MRTILLAVLSLSILCSHAEAPPLAALIKENASLLDRLPDSLTDAQFKKLAAFKEQARRALSAGGKLTLLTNTEQRTAWFGGVLLLSEEGGKAYFVDRQGKWFTEHLKDRVLGGTITGADGRSGFFAVFYDAPGSAVFYKAYLGTTAVKVISFNLDRNTGSLTGSVQMPSGKRVSVTRKGRDNATVLVGDKPLNPLFL